MGRSSIALTTPNQPAPIAMSVFGGGIEGVRLLNSRSFRTLIHASLFIKA